MKQIILPVTVYLNIRACPSPLAAPTGRAAHAGQGSLRRCGWPDGCSNSGGCGPVPAEEK